MKRPEQPASAGGFQKPELLASAGGFERPEQPASAGGFQKPELLAPAGDFEKLKTALYFGADAVYLGGKQFSLRSFAGNFTAEEMKEAVSYAHARGKKVYVAANIFARNADFPALADAFAYLQKIGADAALVSDPGAFALARRVAPRLPLHISVHCREAAFHASQPQRHGSCNQKDNLQLLIPPPFFLPSGLLPLLICESAAGGLSGDQPCREKNSRK